MPSEALLTAFRLQAGACKLYGSPLYQRLCEEGLEDMRRQGPVWQLVRDWDGDPLRGFLALRVLGAVHERVLAGEAPALARHYPSTGGEPAWPGAWDAFLDVVSSQADALRPRLEFFPQTNEVRRCGALLAAFLELARRFGHPLRVRELGSSAGLNLLWDRYRYALGPHRWGRPDAPVAIDADWHGEPAPFDAAVTVESRAGCDLAPRDVNDREEMRRLEGFIWPDQPDRVEPFRGAVRIARAEPVRVDCEDAVTWLPREIAAPAEGVTRVVHHSAFWIYLTPEAQQQIVSTLEEAGAAATESSPLAWLRLEGTNRDRPGTIEIWMRCWPSGEDVHLGDTHPHGREVRWKPTTQSARDAGGEP